jgi:hypothetical protein
MSTDPTIVLVQLAMLDAGILPVIPGYWALASSDERDSLTRLRAHMATLSPEERRQAARKFRKAWRRALREYQVISSSKEGLGRAWGVRKAQRLCKPPEAGSNWRPSRGVMRERMHQVYSFYLRHCLDFSAGEDGR